MSMLKTIFSPIRIGKMQLDNRIVMSPMEVNQVAPDGSVSDAMIAYYEARARGGVGLIIVEQSAVDPRGKAALPAQTAVWDDAYIPGLTKLVRAVHAHAVKIALQLGHSGRQTSPVFIGGQPPVAPSPVPCPVFKAMPHELTGAEIEDIIEKFGQAARRAEEAGFDAVEIHGSHGYLVAQFMSAYSNKRTDEYGGSIEGRLKFPLEVIKRIKEKAGRKYPLMMRLAGYEPVPGGRTIDETKCIVPILVEAGLDALDVTLGTYANIELLVPSSQVPIAFNVSSAEAVKKVSRVPVAAVGRINDPLVAEAIIAQGRADLVALGRALLADPDLPRKAKAGALQDIRRCIGCNSGCLPVSPPPPDLMWRVSCMVNPFAGREMERVVVPASKPKKVLVAGGGPGGMEAALIAAQRGHQVTLWEKSDRLGGQLNVAAIPPYKQEFAEAVRWFSTQVRKSGIKVELNREVTASAVAEMKPEVVIVAIGAVPLIPNIPGIDNPKVVTALDVLAGKVMVGDKVVILGGGRIGPETADFLGHQGKQITIIEMRPEIGLDLAMGVTPFLMARLIKYGVRQVTSARVVEITDDGVTYVTGEGRRETLSGMDSIILALGAKSMNELGKQLTDRVAELYVIGDAKEPRLAFHAVAEGAEVALKI